MKIPELVNITSVLLPLHLIPPERIADLRDGFIQLTIEKAVEGTEGKKKLDVRDLMPSDIGLTNEVWYERTGATKNTWENSAIASKKIADGRWICIWGVTDNSEVPSVSALRFDAGGSKVALWHLDKLNGLQHKAAIAMSPVIVSEGISLTIEHYVKVAASQTELVYDGCVVEISGKKLRA